MRKTLLMHPKDEGSDEPHAQGRARSWPRCTRRSRQAVRPGSRRSSSTRSPARSSTRGAPRSNFLNYHGFPAVICTSPNDMIVHGIPGDYVLKEGDIISIDCGAIIEGYHGDAAFTVPVGEVDAEAARLIEVTDGQPRGRHQPDGRRATDLRHRPRGPDGRRGRRVLAWCGSTSATPSARPCTRSPRSRNYGPPGRGLKLQAGTCSPSSPWSTSGVPRPGPWTTAGRVVTADGSPLRPLRAHHRRHRRRPRGPHVALIRPPERRIRGELHGRHILTRWSRGGRCRFASLRNVGGSPCPSPRKTRSCSRGRSSSRSPTPCSGWSSRTATRCSPTSPGRCACTTSASCPGDRVQVELTPYDLTRGRITYRYK